MKATVSAVIAMFLALAPAHAQQTQNPSAPAQATVPIPGIEDAKLAASARASKLIGSTIHKGDASIGKIEDVLVDLDHASLTAVIISVGGFLGIGDKLVAVPVNQIKVSNEAKFTTDLTKEQLTAAPAFDFGKLQ